MQHNVINVDHWMSTGQKRDTERWSRPTSARKQQPWHARLRLCARQRMYSRWAIYNAISSMRFSHKYEKNCENSWKFLASIQYNVDNIIHSIILKMYVQLMHLQKITEISSWNSFKILAAQMTTITTIPSEMSSLLSIGKTRVMEFQMVFLTVRYVQRIAKIAKVGRSTMMKFRRNFCEIYEKRCWKIGCVRWEFEGIWYARLH